MPKTSPITYTQTPKENHSFNFAAVMAAEREHLTQKGDPEFRTGIAFSGGGIRSACVSLGLTQALAEAGMLEEIDYMSAISGGGYFLGWFSAWVKRSSFRTVKDALGGNLPKRTVGTGNYQRYIEPEPIHHLRRYSAYLTPRVGLFSGDSLAMASIYIRNLLLNFTFVCSALLAILMFMQTAGHLRDYNVHGQALPALLQGVFRWTTYACFAFAVGFIARQLRMVSRGDAGAPATWPMRLGVVGCCTCWLMRPHSFTASTTLLFAIAGAVIGYLFYNFFLPASELPTPEVEPVDVSWHRLVWMFFAWSAAGLVTYGFGVAFLHWTTGPDYFLASKSYAIFGLPVTLLAFPLISYAFVGVMGKQLPDAQREWLARFSGFFFACAAVSAVFLLIVIEAPIAAQGLFYFYKRGNVLTRVLTLLASVVPGGWLYLIGKGLRKANSPDTAGTESNKSWTTVIVTIAPPLFVAGLTIFLSIGSSFLLMALGLDSYHALKKLLFWGLLAAFAATGTVLGWQLDVNEFSLHLFYRNRLVRAFLGASRTVASRKANIFTGFSKDDDIPMSTLHESATEDGPYPIWGTTLNLTTGEDLAWQQRKGASFFYSPLFCGWDYVPPDQYDAYAIERGGSLSLPTEAPASTPLPAYGFRSTRTYGGSAALGGRTLVGTAMAASGAAAAPNMGYHSKPSVAALMTIFNIRLGWWTGNPRSKCWNQYAPGIGYYLSELAGRTTASDDYVYLSDGGHFENLGIYELVRRRVRFIISSDADADLHFGFENLGNAVERCRRDFGVDIEIGAVRDISLGASAPYRKLHYSFGKIVYDPANPDTDGILLYIKSSLTNDEPSDLLALQAVDTKFPHDTTANQSFTENLFEAYRALGKHMMEAVFSAYLQGAPAKPTATLFSNLRDALTKRVPYTPPRTAVKTP